MESSFGGSAYVFVRSETVWTQEMKLNSADVEDADYFGHSVSISVSQEESEFRTTEQMVTIYA